MNGSVSEKVKNKFTAYPKRVYPKGQMLLFANEEPRYIFYIVKGKVRAFAITPRGDEVIAAIYSNGALFPMSWAINHSPNPFFFKAEEESVIHLVPRDDVNVYLIANPDIVLDMFKRLYSGLDSLYNRIIHLMSSSARIRLLHELLTEANQFGKVQNNNNIRLNITEQDLAAKSGMARETVSREMQKLKKRHWISIGKSRGIVILDIKAIKAALGDQG